MSVNGKQPDRFGLGADVRRPSIFCFEKAALGTLRTMTGNMSPHQAEHSTSFRMKDRNG